MCLACRVLQDVHGVLSAPWGADRRIMPYNISRLTALSSFQEFMLILEHLWYFGQDFPAQVIHSCPKGTQESICLWDDNSGVFTPPTIVKRLLSCSNFNSSENVSTNAQKLNRWCYSNYSWCLTTISFPCHYSSSPMFHIAPLWVREIPNWIWEWKDRKTAWQL